MVPHRACNNIAIFKITMMLKKNHLFSLSDHFFFFYSYGFRLSLHRLTLIIWGLFICQKRRQNKLCAKLKLHLISKWNEILISSQWYRECYGYRLSFCLPTLQFAGNLFAIKKSDKTQSKHSYRLFLYRYRNNNIIKNWFGQDNQIWYCDSPQFEHTEIF